jgi:hypothetical protein
MNICASFSPPSARVLLVRVAPSACPALPMRRRGGDEGGRRGGGYCASRGRTEVWDLTRASSEQVWDPIAISSANPYRKGVPKTRSRLLFSRAVSAKKGERMPSMLARGVRDHCTVTPASCIVYTSFVNLVRSLEERGQECRKNAECGGRHWGFGAITL